MAEAPFTIVVATFYSEGVIGPCLTSIPDQYPVVVVDNGSTDGTVTEARTARPGPTIIELGRNLGFGSACNHGIAASPTPLVLLQNPDAQMPPETYEALVRAMEATPGAALLGADRKGSGEASGRLVDTDYVSGSAMLIRRAAFEPGPVFDENIFLYAEDRELCERALKTGWRVANVAGAAVYHARRDSSPSIDVPQALRERLQGQGQAYRMQKWHPRTWRLRAWAKVIELTVSAYASPKARARRLGVAAGVRSYLAHGKPVLWDNPLSRSELKPKETTS